MYDLSSQSVFYINLCKLRSKERGCERLKIVKHDKSKYKCNIQ